MRFVTIECSRRAALLGLALAAGLALAEDEQAIREILRTADRARGSMKGIIWDVEVHSVEGRREETLAFNISNRGFDFLAVYTAPPRQRDAKLLMVSRNMWFHRPGLSKPVPISQRQRLLGKAAYGDLAATNYAEEYDPARLPDETVDGQACHVFDLRAKSNKTTYDRIRYWVSRQSGLGVQAQFFTLSGKPIKTARMEYGNEGANEAGGKQAFVSRITFHDELIGQGTTTIRFGPPTLKALPDSLFDLNVMSR